MGVLFLSGKSYLLKFGFLHNPSLLPKNWLFSFVYEGLIYESMLSSDVHYSFLLSCHSSFLAVYVLCALHSQYLWISAYIIFYITYVYTYHYLCYKLTLVHRTCLREGSADSLKVSLHSIKKHFLFSQCHIFFGRLLWLLPKLLGSFY